MLKVLKWFIGLFSPYVDPFERKVDKFFKSIKSTDNIASIRKDLLKLMQQNLIVVNVWLEKKFKGYSYLTKKKRRKMYEDIAAIKTKLNEHSNAYQIDYDQMKKHLSHKGIELIDANKEKVGYIYSIMEFLKPGKYYKYIKTASFGKLLRDPNESKLEGDCNQIVTLYIYLFSLKYPVEELEIKLLPEHVCLHFKNIDIEATTGTFEKYTENRDVLPITEIISTNLLDLSDFREEVQSISERDMVKSAQLAYAISSLKSLVAKNLNIAYRNLGISAMKANNFSSAVFYLSKTDDRELVDMAYRNAAIYYMKSNNFSKARHYASKSRDKNLIKTIQHNEGVYYYKKDKLDKAYGIFSDLGDEKMKKACLGKKYNKLAKKVSGVKTLEDAKKHKSTYRKMLSLAQKMGDLSLADSVRSTLKKL